MPPAKSSTKRKDWIGIIGVIKTPLGFYVLALLIVESMMSLVLTFSKLDSAHVWEGFKWMVAAFVGIVLIVTLFVIFNPKNLLYGKEEHRDLLEPSALKDQIEDLIVANVKSECLKTPNP